MYVCGERETETDAALKKNQKPKNPTYLLMSSVNLIPRYPQAEHPTQWVPTEVSVSLLLMPSRPGSHSGWSSHTPSPLDTILAVGFIGFLGALGFWEHINSRIFPLNHSEPEKEAGGCFKKN